MEEGEYHEDAEPLVAASTEARNLDSLGLSPHRASLRRPSTKIHGGVSFRPSLLADGLMVYLARSLRAVLLGSKLNILMPFTALAMIASASDWSEGVVFAFALVAICPFAERLGYITEQLCLETKNPTLSGLVNATFGNVTELIISMFALVKGKENPLMLRIVQASSRGHVTPGDERVFNSWNFYGYATLHIHPSMHTIIGAPSQTSSQRQRKLANYCSSLVLHLINHSGAIARNHQPLSTDPPADSPSRHHRLAFWAQYFPTYCWFWAQRFSWVACVIRSRPLTASAPEQTPACSCW